MPTSRLRLPALASVLAVGSLVLGLPEIRAQDLPEDGPDPTIAHLPTAIQEEILTWRQTLASARCMKLVCDSDETWANLYDLDDTGAPRVALRERFQIHSWMTPDIVWMVIFPYEDDAPDTSQPHYQLLWKKNEQLVWERAWIPEASLYRVRRYECDKLYGPTDGSFYSKGCIYATGMESWIAGTGPFCERRGMAPTMGLMRDPELAFVPPDWTRNGVWLDVFEGPLARDEHPEPESLYRRRDFMLLARDATGLACPSGARLSSRIRTTPAKPRNRLRRSAPCRIHSSTNRPLPS